MRGLVDDQDTPPPAGGPSLVEKWVMRAAVMYAAKRLVEVTAMTGYRTYLIMAAIGVLSALHGLQYVGDGLYQTLLGILAPAGVVTLKAGLKKTVDAALAATPPPAPPA